MNEKVLVQNQAVSGRSSKSFIDEGRLNQIADHIQANDYLKQYIQQAKMKQAFPVLITPVQRI